MKSELLIWFLLMAINSSAQSSEQPKDKVVAFRTTNGDSIRVTAAPFRGRCDTAQLVIESILNKNSSEIQRLETPFSFPLNISLFKINGSRGIAIQYDPGARWGNSFLYLFDENAKRLRKLPNFEKLGELQSVTVKKKRHFQNIED